MYFCGKLSKFNIGDNVYLIAEQKEGIIQNIGILGGKLSNWEFLYEVSYENKIINCLDKNINNICLKK